MRKQEIEPVVGVLKELKQETKKIQAAEGKEFYKTGYDSEKFTEQLCTLSDKVLNSHVVNCY
jgi:hypothetical protein